MAFINKVSNFLLGISEIAAPTGVWEKIIVWFNTGIPNYGWAIVIFTLALKLVLLPLDFFNRKMTEKNSRVQALIQPEVANIQKKFAGNKQIINQKTMEIYKKHNYNVTGSCFTMLLNMGLTLFIFITLFSGLNSMAAYKVGYQYQEMEKVYVQYVDSTEVDVNEAVLAKYNEIKDSWLWISNVWKSDTPWTKSVTTFDEFVSMAGIQYKAELKEGEEETFKLRLEANKLSDKEVYENVMLAIDGENKANGYLIIPILAVASTALSMLATQGKLKFKKKKSDKEKESVPAAPANPVGGGWIMTIVLSALMGYITLTYNSVFALYILVGSLFGLATTPLINWGIKKVNAWQDNRKKKMETATPSYKK